MGRDFDASVPPFRRFLDRLAASTGRELRPTMFRGPKSVLFPESTTSEPSLFMEVVVAMSLAVTEALARAGVRPDAVAGRSLGEYTAAAAAGALDAQTLLEAVRRLGRTGREICHRNLRRERCRMLTVFGLPRAEVEGLLRETAPLGRCELATHMSHRRLSVVGGPLRALEEFKRRARRRGGARVVPCREGYRGGALHTSWMSEHARIFRAELDGLPFRRAALPLWSAVDARPVRDGERIRELLCAQLDRPVLWEETVLGLARAGTRVFVEIAPGSMLTDFLFPLPEGVSVLRTDTPAALRAAIRQLRD
jgi:[acyl-carrier-protein] S-malonyltransferase